MDTRGRGFLDIDDLLHLVGRAHMQYPTVPIDALLYEADASYSGRPVEHAAFVLLTVGQHMPVFPALL
eukprot:11935426-Alexandrium_andersonii.AAC.1